MTTSDDNRQLQKLKDEIAAQKEKVRPLREACDKAERKLDSLEIKLEKYRLDHNMFYPISQLSEFKDEESDIESICFVQRKKNGKFKTYWIFNDDLLFIYEDGTFKYSSYDSGVIMFDKSEKKWVHDFYHTRKHLDDFVGFMEIHFVDENKYQVVPPDVEVYKNV